MVSPDVENFTKVDREGYPIFSEADTQYIPPPKSPEIINPSPGCFAQGPGPLRSRKGMLSINTASFVTYGRIYEIMLILEKVPYNGVNRHSVG